MTMHVVADAHAQAAAACIRAEARAAVGLRAVDGGRKQALGLADRAAAAHLDSTDAKEVWS